MKELSSPHDCRRSTKTYTLDWDPKPSQDVSNHDRPTDVKLRTTYPLLSSKTQEVSLGDSIKALEITALSAYNVNMKANYVDEAAIKRPPGVFNDGRMTHF